MTDAPLDRRLDALESRLARLETLLGSVNDKLEGAEQTKAAVQAWVTDYVSLRLQQLVPETCEHDEEEAAAPAEGPVLPGTRVRASVNVARAEPALKLAVWSAARLANVQLDGLKL